MKLKLSTLIHTTILLISLGASQISHANSAISILSQLGLDGWLVGSVHTQIATELAALQEDIFSTLSDDEIHDALWMEAPGIARPKKCYFYGRKDRYGRDLCHNGADCEFWHKDMTEEEEKAAKIEKRNRKKAAAKYKQLQVYKPAVHSNVYKTHDSKYRKHRRQNHNGQHNNHNGQHSHHNHNYQQNHGWHHNHVEEHCSTTQASSTHSNAVETEQAYIEQSFSTVPLQITQTFMHPYGGVYYIYYVFDQFSQRYIAHPYYGPSIIAKPPHG